ncbi:4-hydroxy-tetrahydrodipicolinate synthase family protein [Solimonas marina]|uniref:4-hydroxy-tetrahydrodipicolinate synthase n=1 Tax=Solimonas marina TaxID=2714601 RepID=A0A969W8M5_9GAMM|nr:4-hydroxy-tetrahydrodipicolinate synthase [Solimonas marina]NKF20971.1 4-hydroxy-tetrahydrodipicolinate synthase [Solimonas marina]
MESQTGLFSGIWVPLVTPFAADGAVDHDALRRLAQHLAPHVAGLVVCGSTGEAHALDDGEQLAVLDSVRAAAPDTRLMFGLGGPHLGHLHDTIAALRTRRLDALLVTPPYYVRPSQAALIDYYLALADASPWPIVVYNIPYRTGVALSFEAFAAIARHPNIRAVKDCGGDPTLTLELITHTPLAVLAGEDGHLLATLALGGSGAIAASAHLHPQRFAAVHAAMQDGRLADAQRHFHALWPLIRTLFDEPNPAGIKAALAAQGWIDARCRAPMHAATDGLRQRLATMLADPPLAA